MTSSRIQPPQELSDFLPIPEQPSQPAKAFARGWGWLALVFILSALYMAHELKRGWIPADDGVLAESAERVLHGALPHRDYHELYTGLLSLLNAVAFRVWGTSLASMRYMIFIFFMAWVPAFYYAASRFVSARIAAIITALAVVWGLPICATPMPSWYNLFFATFGLAALLRYIEVHRRRWLVVAGICGGISVLFKITGLYFVAAVLLFLLFREQTGPNAKPDSRREIVLYRAFLIFTVLLYQALLLSVLRKQANLATYCCFWLPNFAIGVAIIWYEFYVAGNRNRRFFFLFRELCLFGAGVAFPVAAFLMPYLVTGSLSKAFTDLLIQPAQMIQSGSITPAMQWLFEGGVMNLLLIGIVLLARSKTAPKLWDEVLFALALALLIPPFLLLVHQNSGFFQVAWSTIWILAPFVVMLGLGLLARWSTSNRLEPIQRQRLFVTLSVTAACSLIQFPFAIPIYYCYVAPLVLLSATAVISLIDHPPRPAVAGMICFYFLYAVFELTPGFVFTLGFKFAPDIQTHRFSVPRAGGLLVSDATGGEYEQLDRLIRQHARGEYILAADNCPQVYFLSGLRAPTRDFQVFSSDFGQSPEGILKTLRERDVNFIVLNHLDSMFVRAVPDDLHDALKREFPSYEETKELEIRWKP